jgi:hypothetical protein
MEKLLCSFLMMAAGISFGQSIQITEMTATAVTGGINVNLKTVSFNGAGFLGYDYVVSGNVVTVNACYWFNVTLPVLTFDNDLFVPVTESNTYTVNVGVYNSVSPDTCDYFSLGDTATASVLSTDDLKTPDTSFALFPNPTTGAIYFIGQDRSCAIEIFDISGRLVKKLATETSQQIDLSGLDNGIYLVRIDDGERQISQKIIVRK